MYTIIPTNIQGKSLDIDHLVTEGSLENATGIFEMAVKDFKSEIM